MKWDNVRGGNYSCIACMSAVLSLLERRKTEICVFTAAYVSSEQHKYNIAEKVFIHEVFFIVMLFLSIVEEMGEKAFLIIDEKNNKIEKFIGPIS